MGSRRDLAPDLFLSFAVGLPEPHKANPAAATAPVVSGSAKGALAPAIWSVCAANATNRRPEAFGRLKTA